MRTAILTLGILLMPLGFAGAISSGNSCTADQVCARLNFEDQGPNHFRWTASAGCLAIYVSCTLEAWATSGSYQQQACLPTLPACSVPGGGEEKVWFGLTNVVTARMTAEDLAGVVVASAQVSCFYDGNNAMQCAANCANSIGGLEPGRVCLASASDLCTEPIVQHPIIIDGLCVPGGAHVVACTARVDVPPVHVLPLCVRA